jgi:hypothetical protein
MQWVRFLHKMGTSICSYRPLQQPIQLPSQVQGLARVPQQLYKEPSLQYLKQQRGRVVAAQ